MSSLAFQAFKISVSGVDASTFALWEGVGKAVIKITHSVHKMCTKFIPVDSSKTALNPLFFVPTFPTVCAHLHPQFVIYITGSTKSFLAFTHSFHSTNNKNEVNIKDL